MGCFLLPQISAKKSFRRSTTEHAEELEHNIDVILQDQDVCQRHYPGEQNRSEECFMVKTLLMTLTRNNILTLLLLLLQLHVALVFLRKFRASSWLLAADRSNTEA